MAEIGGESLVPGRSEARLEVVVMTEAIVKELAPVHREAFEGNLSARLGQPYANAFLRWFQGNSDALSFVLIGNGGQALGYVVGAPLGYQKTMNRHLGPVALRALLARPWLLADRKLWKKLWARVGALTGRAESPDATPTLPGPTMSLVGIGVTMAGRGRGAGRLLMEAFEKGCLERRMASMRLSVFTENVAARKLYERCEWTAFPVPGGEFLYYSKLLA